MKTVIFMKNNFKQFNKSLILVFVFLLSLQTGYSQEDDNVEIVTHKVALGETMLMISKKYLVSPTQIYRLNKKAIDGISEGMILYIPQPIKSQEIITERKEKREKEKIALVARKKEREEREVVEAKIEEAKASEVVVAVNEEKDLGRRENISKLKISDKDQFIDHQVASGETLNNLSKRYGVSVEEIEKVNEKVLKNGLQSGTTLKMPVAQNLFINNEPEQVISTISSEENNNDPKSEISHKVSAGETLYSISRKYGVSVGEISNENVNVLKNGLQPGQQLKIKTSKSVVVNEVKAEPEKIINTNEIVDDNTNSGDYTTLKHLVEPKETLYSISKKYNVTVDDIKHQNESILTKGLQSGQEITIRVKK